MEWHLEQRFQIRRAADDIVRARRVAALTGAGISVESGIPPFRGGGGLWDKYDPEEYGHIDSFLRDPAKVWTMLREFVEVIAAAQPNPAHHALAELERLGRLHCIITQNVDGLHQAAGSTDVVEFHGNNRWLVCMSCGRRFPAPGFSLDVLPPRCDCRGVLKPDAIFFGELIPPEALNRARKEAMACDIMLVIGTSALVEPAASMPVMAARCGNRVVEINPEETPLTASVASYMLQGPAGAILPVLAAEVRTLLGSERRQ